MGFSSSVRIGGYRKKIEVRKNPNRDLLVPGEWRQRCQSLLAEHLTDMGGEDNISANERAILKRAIVIIAECERLELKFVATNGEADIHLLDLYQRMSNSLRRLLESLGLQRRPKTVAPDLATYLKQRRFDDLQDAAE